ncbi:hypothetical protein KP509_20G006100 [Ceratopteris richardii]|uniref:Uncharacterized protein n=1 Tax=Ceratopteris richardii TaxID=49495 RepID=A0A8T2SCP4_CERRI|nr:hypothetical protein KP509_20G006100 [Ceratopteris richardii]
MLENPDDERLLSILGVTAANPEDIERRVIAAAEERARRERKKKRLEADQEEEEKAQVDDEYHFEEESHQEALLRNRLKALEQEINAVAAGLESLEQKQRDESLEDTGNASENEPQEGERREEASGSQLQRALAEERIASLENKKAKLLQKLAILQAGMADSDEEDDDNDRFKEATNRHLDDRKRKSVVNVTEYGIVATEIDDDNDDDDDVTIESTSGFVETERDRLIRTGVVTPFDRLKGFERRVESGSFIDPNRKHIESSIANVVASMAASAKARPTTKLLDASELPKLAPPTREFRRIRKIQRHADTTLSAGKTPTKKQGNKRKRPLPDIKWRRQQLERDASERSVDPHDANESAYDSDFASSSVDNGEEDAKLHKKKKKIRDVRESDGEENIQDILLEGGLRIPSLIYGNLFDYQRTGVKWLWELHCQKAGGIIADEMGLGKTIQVTAFLASLHYSGLYEPSIVVCPVTLLRQWKRELQKWYEPFEVEILHDSAASNSSKSVRPKNKKSKQEYSSEEDNHGESEEDSDEVRESVKLTKKKKLDRWDALIKRIVSSKSGLLVTTYEQLRILREKLLDQEWGYAVLDEGHRIRNPDAEITLVCKQLQTVHRIIMTGAPIQNKLTELWSLFDFVFPGKLGVLPVFQAQFSLPISIGGYTNATPLQVSTAYKCAVVLRDLIMPYLLRRLKSDVNAHLTKKTEHVLFCSLTEEQRSAYRAFLGSTEVEQIFDGNRNSLYGIDILRKICNHADLLEREQSSNHPDFGNPERSGKLKVLGQVLDVWHSQGHRVLIFSQTQQMLDIIENYCISKNFIYRRMDGSTPIRQRAALIDEFNESSHVFVFILTTRVGGLGTNLIGANKVVIFDPDWNPSTDMQARERAWRIGQTRDVTVYRLITRGTIEEKVYHRQIYKHFLTNKILKDPKQRRIFKARDLRDLFTLNEDKHEVKTETSALFSEVSNVDLNHVAERAPTIEASGQSPGSRCHGSVSSSDERAKTSTDDINSQEDESHILKCLFEANGIHSALNHEAIESMNDSEKTMIDNESARVAQRAAAAVMQSRLQRRSDNVAVPTWTGRSGAAGAPSAVRRRFGSTTNSSLLPSVQHGSGHANQIDSQGPLRAGMSTGRALSSSDVLARLRGGVGSVPQAATYHVNGVSNDSRGTTRVDSLSLQVGAESSTLHEQLCSFIEQQGGSVSSARIVEKFKDSVPPNRAAYFRQVLKEVAVLKKEGSEGCWVLKSETQ